MSIYLDNAATTAPKPQVVDAIRPYLAEQYGNASSIHAVGRNARKAIERARAHVADAIGARPQEIYFTAGGTESDNWAIKGAAFAHSKKGKHIITSAIEHHAVLYSCEWLQKQGFDVTYLPVDEHGLLSPSQVEAAIRPDTILITIMTANNEIGTIQPVAEIGALARARKILFHTDAVQAVGAMPIDVNALNVDMLSLSGHKFYGIMGVGALYIRQGVRIDNLVHGGAQERGRRAGTENLPAFVGLGAAIELATRDIEEHATRLTNLRDRLIHGIFTAIPHVRLNGHPTRRLPGNVNVSVEYIEGEALLLRLDLAGFEASSGSACTSGSLDPSHVLLAIGLPHEVAHGSLRLSLGDYNTEQDVDALLAALPGVVQTLRDMSPVYQDSIGEAR